jgi:hypothetical protein
MSVKLETGSGSQQEEERVKGEDWGGPLNRIKLLHTYV